MSQIENEEDVMDPSRVGGGLDHTLKGWARPQEPGTGFEDVIPTPRDVKEMAQRLKKGNKEVTAHRWLRVREQSLENQDGFTEKRREEAWREWLAIWLGPRVPRWPWGVGEAWALVDCSFDLRDSNGRHIIDVGEERIPLSPISMCFA
ncbi:hypothetical protein CRG98_043951 [Punica granatum]|uniref:Uncharacterized protein n=1 Tax=Punica granatum TaxID=22663 RepID=A0A2I0HVD1_PUNGR|nr:hypothetical protein CRG98_043951 [Punica granatum]